ncbi:MAG: hypothetical protein IPG45_20285 [Deltaproteobacteria bacterium]|nr:hypothetical protein [Deltaproteobacteria bacterium]
MPASFHKFLSPLLFPLGVLACSSDAHEDPPAVVDSGVPQPNPDGGVPGDGGLDDGGPNEEGPVTFLDWSTERGAPLDLTVEQELPGRAFALSDTAYAIQNNCQEGVCDYTWYRHDGTVLRQHLGLAPAASDWFSPDGTQFAAVEVDDQFVCTSMGWSLPLVEGTWGLYDARTGERRVAHGPLVADPHVIQSSFTRFGSMVRLETYDRARCEIVTSTPLSTVAPYAEPEVLTSIPSDPGYPPYVEDDTRDGQLIITTREGLNTPVGVVHPSDLGSYRRLDGDHQLARESGGFLHVLGGWPFNRATSMLLSTGARRDAPLASNEADFTATVVSHRWIVTCTQSLYGQRRCDATDGLGVYPRRTFTAGASLPALAGGADHVVTSTSGGEITQLDLRTGLSSRLGLASMPARVVGNGAGVVLQDQDEIFGLTRDQLFRIGGRGQAVLVGATQVEQPQSDVVFVVSSNETGSLTYLDIWNVATKKIARVTDQLFFNPPHNAPFTADEQCAVPGFLRSVGPPAASAAQPGRFLHFTQFVPAAQPKIQVFVVPADLSAPPRMLAELEPDQCSPPLISNTEDRVWLPVVTPGGVKVALAPL